MNYNGYKFDFICDPLPSNNFNDDTDISGNNDSDEYNASKSQYESRFWDDYNPDDPLNIPGYGLTRPWVAPLSAPDSLIAIYDRYMLSSRLSVNPLIEGVEAWAEGLGSGDSWDGYVYNNAAAAGSQLYPSGLSKYFDLHSLDGLIGYTFNWIWDLIQAITLPFTLFVPIDVWLAIFNGASLEGLWKIFLFYEPFLYLSLGLPSLVARFFHVEMEDGWGIMEN